MADLQRELNSAASALATAILDAGILKGDKRTNVGAEIERKLKAFAEVIVKQVRQETADNPKETSPKKTD